MERQPPSRVLASSRSQEQLVLPFYFSLPRSEEEGCAGGKSVSVSCATVSLPMQQSEQLLLRPTKMHHDSIPPPCLLIFQRIEYVQRMRTYMYMHGRSHENRLEIALAFTFQLNCFGTFSNHIPRWFRNRFRILFY